jgi:signal transduction histidine kinase
VKEQLDPEILSELLGLLAHDLRNPLSALQSNVGFLGSLIGPEDRDARDAVSDAVLSCDGLNHIIDSVELLAQVLGEPSEFERTVFALGPLLTSVVDGCQSLAASHEVRLELDPAAGQKQVRASAHRELAGRALAALVRNSIQHAPVASVVRVGLRVDEGTVVVSVSDAGQPLAPDLVEEAFTARGQTRTKALSGGRYSRGLGLFCARVCADSSGARVCAGSRGAGNVFELILDSRL